MATKPFKSWDSPASGSWGGRIKKSYSPSYASTFTSWRDYDWAGLGVNCDSAYQIALAEVNSDIKEEYKAFLARKAELYESMNPEAGSYEGNLSDKYPMPKMTLEEIQHIKQRATADVVDYFCETNGLKNSSIQLLQQLVTYIGNIRLTTVDGDDYYPSRVNEKGGLISGRALYNQIFATAEGKGLYYFLMYDNRSSYLETQYKGPAKNFCALVPIVLYAFKLIKGIPYSHWHRSDIRGVVNPKLADAMLWDEEEYPKPERDAILTARNEGLQIKTGAKAGQPRNPVYTFKLYGKTILTGIPDYVQVMYSQIWCAHPENRTKYMILDPSNWDTVPPALVDTETLAVDTKPLTPSVRFERTVNKEDLAW